MKNSLCSNRLKFSPKTHLLQKINLRVLSHFEKCYFIGSNFSWYLWGQNDSSTLQLSFMLLSFFKVEIALGIQEISFFFFFFYPLLPDFRRGKNRLVGCSKNRKDTGRVSHAELCSRKTGGRNRVRISQPLRLTSWLFAKSSRLSLNRQGSWDSLQHQGEQSMTGMGNHGPFTASGLHHGWLGNSGS